MTDTAKLKPCPFCGGEAVIERSGSRRQSMIVSCTNCGCRVESGDVHGLTPFEAWRWNRQSEIERLEKIIRKDVSIENALLAEAEIARLKEALEPFAQFASACDTQEIPDACPLGCDFDRIGARPNIGDCRTARAFLSRYQEGKSD